MTKTYKHRTMGRVAEKRDHINSGDYTINAIDANYSRWSIAYPNLRVVRTIPCELIENSSDREEEEVVEKDWIHKVLLAMFDHTEQSVGLNPSEVRQAIEKNAPKTVKFTVSELWEFSEKHFLDLPYNHVVEGMIRFFKDNNLLSSDEQGNIDM